MNELEPTRKIGRLERELVRWLWIASFLGCVALMLTASLVYAGARISRQAEMIEDISKAAADQAETHELTVNAWEGQYATATGDLATCEGDLYSAGLEVERLSLALGREPLPDDEASECKWTSFVLGQRLDVCLRDRKAAQCALGGEPGCDPVRVDFGGVVNAKR